jgi:hypothetical protein
MLVHSQETNSIPLWPKLRSWEFFFINSHAHTNTHILRASNTNSIDVHRPTAASELAKKSPPQIQMQLLCFSQLLTKKVSRHMKDETPWPKRTLKDMLKPEVTEMQQVKVELPSGNKNLDIMFTTLLPHPISSHINVSNCACSWYAH